MTKIPGTLLYLPVLTAGIILSSCSTILRKQTQKVYVFSSTEGATVTVNDSLYKLPAHVEVKRDRTPVKMEYKSASKEADSLLIPGVSWQYYLLNAPTIPVLGAGYWIDLSNKKRFQYPRNIYFNDKDGLTSYEYQAERHIAKRNIQSEETKQYVRERLKSAYFASEEVRKKKQEAAFRRFNPASGTFRFSLVLPTLYFIGLSSENPNLESFHNETGGISFGIGGDYYYKNTHFVSLELSHKLSNFDPIFFNEYALVADKLDISLRKGHRWKRFEYAYGISFTYTYYKYEVPYSMEGGYIKPFMSDDYAKDYYSDYRSVGFTTLFNYQFTPVLYAGVRYNPSVYSFRNHGDGFDYEHVIGFDFRLKF